MTRSDYAYPIIVLGLFQRGSKVKASAGNSTTLTDIHIPVKGSRVGETFFVAMIYERIGYSNGLKRPLISKEI